MARPGLYLAAALFGACAYAGNPFTERKNNTLLPRSLQTASAATMNILELAQNTASLSNSYRSIVDAKLNFVLSGVGPYTLYAPTNDAWTALGPGVYQSLLLPSNNQILNQLIKYHISPGDQQSTQMILGQSLKTLEEGTSIIVSKISPFKVNIRAKATTADTPTTNGLIHIMDTVLVPQGFAYPAPTRNMVELVGVADYLSTFLRAIGAAGLTSTWTSDGPYTVFAPSNTAFTNLGLGIASSLLLQANQAKLKQVLQFHAVQGRQLTTSMTAGQQIRTMEGGSFALSQVSPDVMINGGVQVTSRDVYATNGLLQCVDTVLIPPNFVYPDKTMLTLIRDSPHLSTLFTAITAADLAITLGGDAVYTIFAPTDAAFKALGIGVDTSLLLPANKDKLVQLLRYHMLPGTKPSDQFALNQPIKTLEKNTITVSRRSPLRVNDATADTADVPATNGMIHIINRVLLPPQFEFPDKDVMQLARTDHQMTEFQKFVIAAGMEQDLKATGPFTVFAPINEAFTSLEPSVYAALLRSENRDTLRKILTYHVINGKTDSSVLTYGRNLDTLEGGRILVTPWTELGWQGIAYDKFAPPVTLNQEVQVRTSNALVTNGIVHLVDKLLIPYPLERTALPGATAAPVGLLARTSGAPRVHDLGLTVAILTLLSLGANLVR